MLRPGMDRILVALDALPGRPGGGPLIPLAGVQEGEKFIKGKATRGFKGIGEASVGNQFRQSHEKIAGMDNAEEEPIDDYEAAERAAIREDNTN